MPTAAEIQATKQEAAAAASALSKFLWRLRNPAEASFQLGCKLVAKERFKEAIFRFKFVLWLQPYRAGAWYNLGVCYLALKQLGEGVAAIKKTLAINPKNETARFLLATIGDGRYAEGYQPHTTPPEMIKSEFAARAEEYEEEEVGNYGYRGHVAVYEAVRDLPAANPTRYEQVLDAGCGTGLLGDLLRPLAMQLTGLDISPEMLAIARKRRNNKNKPVYHHLIEADLRSYLLHQHAPIYDLIAAANVAPILGGLAPMLDGAAKALKTGGWLVFTILPLERGEGYHLLAEERRFAHSEVYLRQLAAKSGLVLHSLLQHSLYPGRNCHVVVMRK